MLRTKKADRIAAFFTAVMLIAAVCLWGAVEPVRGDGSHEIGYESLLFDSSVVHTIEITTDHWDEIIANAAAEEYSQCDIAIDGEKLGTVGIRAKGNTSLSSVATLGSERYSFKVEFDQYTKGKTYHGLDKLSLNNLIQDSTMMKDYLAYTLMGKMGVPSPLCSYAMIIVNGETWGLYLAVEAIEDAFMERNGMTKGELYKPDSMSFGGGRGNGRDFDIENFREKEEDSADTQDSSESKESAVSAETTAEQAQDAGQPAAQGGSDFAGSSGMPAGTGDATQQMPQGQNDFGASGGNSTQQMPQGQSDFGASGGDSTQQMPQGQNDFGASGGDSTQQMPQSGDFAASSGESAAGTNTENTDEFAVQNTDGFPAAPGGDFGGGGFGGGGFGGFNFGMGSDDVKLVYTDDDPESYSNIFNNAKTKITAKDKARLIESLKKLNAKEDLDSVVNKEEVITYLAVHNFLCNDDSYTGMMVHNYYLYEEKGQLRIIPWDYNLGFGGFSASQNATSTVNSPIDNPVSNGTTDSRPLIAWIFSDEEALAAYHETYSRFISECIESGWLAEEINRVQELITPYVEKDPTAFYTLEEFETGVSTMKSFCAKRAESVRGQLDGTIPSTSNGQRNSSALIDASDIDTSAMGSMSGNNGGGGFGGGMPTGMPNMSSGEMPTGMPDMNSGEMPSNLPSNMPSGIPDGTEDGGASFGGSAGSSGESASESPAAPAETPSVTDGTQAETSEATDIPADGTEKVQPAEEPKKENPEKPEDSKKPEGTKADRAGETAERPNMPEGGFGGGNFPGGGFPGGADGFSGSGYSSGIWIWTGVCAAVLLAMILIIRKTGSHNN